MPHKFISCLIFCMMGLAQFSAFGQVTKLSGVAIDGATKQPIQFATVRFSGSTGTTSDSMGRFYLASPKNETELEISAIGYKTQKIRLSNIKDWNNVTISVSPESIALDEISVKPSKRTKRVVDTAAMFVLKQVQDHKAENNARNIPDYHFYEHTKLDISLLDVPQKLLSVKIVKPFGFFFDTPDTTENGTQYHPLLLQEEYNETYHRAKPAVNRKVVYYRKISGLKRNLLANLVADKFDVIDIYDNNYSIADRPFPSPFAPSAKSTYLYFIADTIRGEKGILYKLNFVAKNKQDVALKGYAIVDSATWGIQSISFKPNEKANVNFITDYSVQQTFTKTDSSWLLTDETVTAIANILEKQKKLSVYITKHTVREDVKEGYPIPDSVARAKDDIFVKKAFKQPRNYIDSVRISPLTESEKHVYWAFDTAKAVPAYKRLMWFGTLLRTGYLKAGPIDIGRVDQFVSVNATDGYRLKFAARTNDVFSEKVALYSHVAYGFASKQWHYELDARFKIPSKNNRWSSISLINKNDMVLLGQENSFFPFDNVLTLLSPNNLYRVLNYSVHGITYEHDWFKGLSSNMQFLQTSYFSVRDRYEFRTTDGELIKKFGTTEISGDLRYSKDAQYVDEYGMRTFLKPKHPVFLLKYTAGLKIMNGGYNYHKIELGIKHSIPVPMAGSADIDLRGGYMFGNVPYTAAFTSSSNTSFVKDINSFQLTMPFEFQHDKYVMLWYEHHLDGLIFNHIPLVKKLKLREMISVKALWGTYSKSNQNLVAQLPETHTSTNVPYVEVGVGVENILKVFQLSFIWRATYRNTPSAENFGVKLGIRPGF